MTRVTIRILVPLLLLLSAVPATQAAITETPLPEGLRKPLNLEFDAEGDLWITLDGTWGVARYRPSEDAFDVARITTPKMSPHDSLFGLLVAPDGMVWTGSQSYLHRISPTDLNVTSFALPTPSQLTGGIWADEEGQIWFALVSAGRVVRLDPETGDVREHPLEERQVGPTMFHERDSKVWMTATYAGSYATFDPANGTVTRGPRGVFAAPVGLDSDDDGLWVAEHGANTLGRIDLRQGRIEHYPASESPHHDFAGPNDVLVARDGAVWFAEHLGERIARLDPAQRILYEYDVPSAPQANVLFLTEAPDGSIWFATWTKNGLGRVDFEDPGPPPQLPDLLTVRRGGTVQASVDEAFSLVGLPRMEMNGTVRDGTLEIDVGAAPVGEHFVLVSERQGDVIRGRYLTLLIEDEEQEDAPGISFMVLPLFLALLGSAGRRRR